MLITGLKELLRTFDSHGRIGSFHRGLWEIRGDGKDFWTYYKGIPAVRFEGNEYKCDGFPDVFDASEKDKMLKVIKEVYGSSRKKVDVSRIFQECQSSNFVDYNRAQNEIVKAWVPVFEQKTRVSFAQDILPVLKAKYSYEICNSNTLAMMTNDVVCIQMYVQDALGLKLVLEPKMEIDGNSLSFADWYFIRRN